MAFPYPSIPPGGTHIRVLEVRRRLSDELIGEFQIINLDDASRRRYMAVSYTWDRSTEATSRLPFSDGRRTLPLSQTLTDLFEAMRRQGLSRFGIWIDALCIANRVILWLGAAFRFMASKGDLPYPDGWPAALTAEDGPRRARAVTLSDHVVMMCGDDWEGFGIFSRCVFAIWRYFRNWDDYDDDHPALLGLWTVDHLVSIRDRFIDLQEPIRWEMLLLTMAFRCEATDHRDSVFALRGIADRTPPVPEPDYTVAVGKEPEYTQAVEQPYRETAIALLCHGTSLDLLALAGLERQRAPGLASWIPDYRHFSLTEPMVAVEIGAWDAGGPMKEHATLLSPDRLGIRAIFLGTVGVVCPKFNVSSVLEQQETMRQVLKLKEKQQLPGVPRPTWLRDLAVDLSLGLDADDAAEHFEEWLDWLHSSTSQADLARIRHHAYHRVLDVRVDGWRAFGTLSNNLFCIGPPETEVGDLVCLVPGCRLPLLVRCKTGPADGEGTDGDFLLVSWCYVSGQMISDDDDANRQGEAMSIVLN
ncbi:HET-domain-containing protein [Xylariomycetidae sp. FL2044]|nr:HET-domain-containing protein [Xylariomycetidae sp. FL2044]